MTARVGEPLHPAVKALLTRTLRAVMREAAKTSARPVALVIVGAGHPRTDAVAQHLGEHARSSVDGITYAAVPLATAQRLADELAPDVAPALRESVGAGESWCLVLRTAPLGSAAVPVLPYSARGSKAKN